MAFEGQYLSYEEYKGLGGTLDLVSFNILQYECEKQIDLRTQNRLKNIDIDKIPQGVKMCVFHLINKIDSYSKDLESINGSVASESIDGYSVSYLNPTQINEIIKSKNVELEDIMLKYLYGIVINGEHIIYNGVQ